MSGKEARNRLIQLLYLSLTALVAILFMRIDSSEHIKIYRSIENDWQQLYKKHNSEYHNIQNLLKNTDDKNKDIKKNIIDLFDTEKTCIESINAIEKKLISFSECFADKEKTKNLDKTSIVKKVMITDKNADVFYTILNSFKEKINTLGYEKDYSFNDDDKIKFDDTALITALLYLAQNKKKITTATDIIYTKLFREIKTEQYTFDKYELIVIPKKDVVFAGKDYEGDVFLNVKIPSTTPEIKVNNEKIQIENNVGKIKIKTLKNLNFDNEGKCSQTFKINFIQKNPETGNNIILDRTVSFTVINKRNIECKNDFSDSLYKFCANNYNIINNDPDNESKLTFKVDYGEVKEISKTSSQCSLVITPTSDQCTLSVFEDNMNVLNKTFVVRDAPMPKINVVINDKIYSENSFFNADDLRGINIMIIPNEDFSSTHPDECNYKVSRWDILLCKNKKIINDITVKNNDKCNLRDNKELLYSCDKIIIQIKQIKRINYKKEEINIFKEGEIITRSYNIINHEDE